MAQQEDVFKKIVSHCKEYGFVFPSSDIYDGLAAVYDYGQNGVELKNNIKQYWWQSMVLLHENIVGIDAAIFMHPTTWKASGHVDAFNDPLIDNRDSKKRYRADVLIEEQLAKYEDKIQKEIEKAQKRFGDAFDEAQFRATNQRVLENQEKYDALHKRYQEVMNAEGGIDLEGMKQIILDEGIVCPISGTRNWTDVRQFNLMFKTEMGSTADGASTIYLRPETAQGIFVNYLNVQKTGRMKLPFGIAQIGKAFRNEIVARQFIFRMREFEQMEMQFFIQPGTELDWFEKWKQYRMKWHQNLGFGAENYRFHDHDKLAHYANAATDIEFRMPSDSRRWKASTAARTSTSRSTLSTAARRLSTSTPTATRATRRTSSRPPSVWTACSSPSCATASRSSNCPTARPAPCSTCPQPSLPSSSPSSPSRRRTECPRRHRKSSTSCASTSTASTRRRTR